MASQRNTVATTSGDNIKLDNAVLDVYAKEVLFKAQPILRFESVATKRTDLQVTPGGKIVFVRYNSLTGKSAIAENTAIETSALATSTIELTVTEHAKAVSVSEKLLRQSFLDVMGDAAALLGMHYAKNRDALLRDAALTSANVLYSQAKGSLTSDRAGLTTASVFDVNLIRDAVEFLATNKAPKYDMDAYICFVHPHQAKTLRKDSAWVNAMNYAQPENLLTGEIGRIEDVRFVESTQITRIVKNTQDIWADGEDTGDNTAVAANAATDTYQAVIVGQNALGLAEALPVEMRDDGIKDFGRTQSLAYYGIWGAGLIETGHIAVLETA